MKQKVFHEYSFSKYVRRKGSPTLLRTCLPNKEDLFLVLQNIAWPSWWPHKSTLFINSCLKDFFKGLIFFSIKPFCFEWYWKINKISNFKLSNSLLNFFFWNSQSFLRKFLAILEFSFRGLPPPPVTIQRSVSAQLRNCSFQSNVIIYAYNMHSKIEYLVTGF